METFSALLAICAGNSPDPGEFPAQRPVTRSFDVFFDLRLNKRLSKQSWGWWFETLSRLLWRHRNAIIKPVKQTYNSKSKFWQVLTYPSECVFILLVLYVTQCCNLTKVSPKLLRMFTLPSMSNLSREMQNKNTNTFQPMAELFVWRMTLYL